MPARILLIEDNPANLELMRYLLEAFGYAPETTCDGQEGLEAASGAAFDLILCDIQMPVVDGYQVARRLQGDPALRTIPLVAVTALAMVGEREKILAAGFSGYIAKPIEPETFVAQVEAFLRSADRRGIAPPGDTSSIAASTHPTPRSTVLVVDNRAVNLSLSQSILEPQGYRVLTAKGIEEGLALARAHPCDLILSDVCLTGESGFDLIRAVKADPQLCNIPFVFLTSTLVAESDRVAGLALGAARYLYRPIEPDALLAEIAACLRAPGRWTHGDNPDRG
jgi:two-component system cell cycle response regulator